MTVLAGMGKVKVRVKYADQKGNSWKKKKKDYLHKHLQSYQLFNILLIFNILTIIDILSMYSTCLHIQFNPFLPRPAKTTSFVNLLCLRGDDFTFQGRASGWERVK